MYDRIKRHTSITSIRRVTLVRGLRVVVATVLVVVSSFTTFAQSRILPAEPPRRLDPVLAGTLKVRLSAASITNASPEDVLGRHGLRVLRPLLPLRHSLQWNPKTENSLLGAPAITRELLQLENELLRSYVVAYSDLSVSPERMCAWLRPVCSDIEVAEPFTISQLTAEPNDTLRHQQPMLALIRIFDAWDVEDGDDTVTIGISDSGVLQTHEDLKDALFVNVNEIPNNDIDDDANGYIDDYNGYNFCTADDGTPPGNTHNPREGHGTGVAGICGAVVNNGIGIAGIASKCRIVPLKTMPDDVGGIVYGYESLIYCVVNNIDVVNCSWGSQSRSCIDESVVAYTIARGVAVVAAAGNHGSAAPFFPAAYKGVLGVGVSDQTDAVIGMSGIGPTVDLMAPGQGTFTTSSNGAYGSFCCTSGAAPIVSGVVALVRSKRPSLSPLEACAVVREAVARSPWTVIPDDKTPALLPLGRLDALAAVSVNPDSIPSVELDTIAVRATSEDTRWTVGDTLFAELRMRNVLSTWTPSVVNLDLAPFRPILKVGVTQIGPVQSPLGDELVKGDTFAISVPLIVTKDTDTSTFIRVQMGNESGSLTQVLAAITPSPAFRVLKNDVMSLSVGDNARVGNVDIDRGQGTGLTFRGFCGQLYEGGLMVGSDNRVVDAVRAVKGTHDYFVPLKKFTRPHPLRGIVRDNKAPDSLRIGVEVRQDVKLASGDSSVYVSDITVTNVSDSTLRDVAVSWFMDWDLGTQPVRNRAELVQYDMQRHIGVEGAWSTNPGEPYVACAVVSHHSDAEPICTGFNNAETYGGFSTRAKDSLMRQGSNVQITEQADVAVISGMRFKSLIPPGGSRSFRMIWSMDLDRDMAIARLNPWLTEHEPSADVVGHPYPNPATDVVSFMLGSQEARSADIAVFNMQGRRVFESNVDLSVGTNVIHIDVRGLGVGMYAVRVTTSGIQRFVFWRG